MGQDVIYEQVLLRARCSTAQRGNIGDGENARSPGLLENDRSRAQQVKEEMETQMSQAL